MWMELANSPNLGQAGGWGVTEITWGLKGMRWKM